MQGEQRPFSVTSETGVRRNRSGKVIKGGEPAMAAPRQDQSEKPTGVFGEIWLPMVITMLLAFCILHIVLI